MNKRLEVICPEHPNFISSWMMTDTSVCDGLIDFFERNKTSHMAGQTGGGDTDEVVKKSTDLSISPQDLEDEKFSVVSSYIKNLMELYFDYLDQWEFLRTFLPKAHIGPFNIQKYDEGGHFSKLHAERTSMNCLQRTLVWMTYLNDVKGGGETEFPMFGLSVKPEKGKTLIWPAEWTHAHRGNVVSQGNKYIITGWMHFPDNT